MSISELLTDQNKTFLRLSVNTVSANDFESKKSISTAGFSFAPNAVWEGSTFTIPAGSSAMSPSQLFSGLWIFPASAPSNFTVSLPTIAQINAYLLSIGLSVDNFIGKHISIFVLDYNVNVGSTLTFNPADWEYGQGAGPIPIQASFRNWRIVRYNDVSGKWMID